MTKFQETAAALGRYEVIDASSEIDNGKLAFINR